LILQSADPSPAVSKLVTPFRSAPLTSLAIPQISSEDFVKEVNVGLTKSAGFEEEELRVSLST
jgi:hypothetical protein